MSNKSSKLADRLFPDQQEDRRIEILDLPPEKRKLNTETYDFSVSTIVQYLDDKHIVVPEFQRGYVWNRSQASRLIESLIIQCPIPVVFLSQGSDEVLSVIDGNQRINSISLFLKDEFPLQGLSAYPELEGFSYSELDPRFKRHILNRSIRCIVILKDTHPQIKFDVFERLNTGSVKLNAQELRHGIYNGTLMELLSEISSNKEWKKISNTSRDKRMKSEELILRFFALKDDWRTYQKPMSSFLSNFAENHQYLDEVSLQRMKKEFKDTVTKVLSLYGDSAFKIYSEKKRTSVNIALFDAQMVGIYESKITLDQISRIDRTKFNNDMLEAFEEEEFAKHIGRATTDEGAVKYRIRKIIKIISENT